MSFGKPQPCTNCNTPHEPGSSRNGRTWRGLGGYFGINGFFCPRCYDKVSHDAYGNPNNPKEYQEILNKQKEAYEASRQRQVRQPATTA